MISKACDLKVLKNLFKIIIFTLVTFFLAQPIFASQNSFVTIVNPIRGGDFWDNKNQSIETAVIGEVDILKKFNVDATWLIRYDGLLNTNVINQLKNLSDEKGLFLEVIPTWTKDAGVIYQKGETWHSAGSAFLTSYELKDREKLIDTSFEKFKQTFSYYPKSVGAWWIDSYSLGYMQKKYGIVVALIVADQYSTDNYQIWGQYFSTPYYPSKNNALHPAQSLENKLPVVMLQWAARDPINSYGNGVGESTYSVQANDYINYHTLGTDYFSKLVDIYTKQPLNKFSQLVVGLENSYDWEKYSKEYERQIKSLVDKKNAGQISAVTMADFAQWYKSSFPQLSPEQIIVADDPLGTFRKAVWFMNPYYRAGWFLNQDGSVFRDIRQYIDGQEELCIRSRCDSVNFATSATRVLDEVSFGHKWIIDQGKIKDFKVRKEGENYVISYANEADKIRTIELMPRDISVDGKISSIDGSILDATKRDLERKQISQTLQYGFPKFSPFSVIFNIIKFGLFLLLGAIVPGYLLITTKLLQASLIKEVPKSFLQKKFLSLIVGLVFLTLLFYITSILKIRPILYLYLILNTSLFIKLKLYREPVNFSKVKGFNLAVALLVVAGTIFQVIPTFKSGLEFPYGIGLWGPNTHDGVWHIALINQLLKAVPPENPIFSGSIIKNYHLFYDLLIAAASYFTNISVSDLVFRYFPIIFSLSLGVGTTFLIWNLFNQSLGGVKTKVAILFSLYLVYFAGSFGWIVEFIKQRHFGGESAFWANQAISFNLNPPFAVSLIIIIALLQLLPLKQALTKKLFLVIVVLTGSLIAFKSYGGVLMLATLFITGLINIARFRDKSLISLFIFSAILSAILFFLNFESSSSFLILSPFWFVNSMIDAPDRVGWERLALTRNVGWENKNWIKFFGAEGLSLLIFIIGNLGLRFISIGVLIKFKKIINNTAFLFLAIFTILSILIPLTFIQAGNPWNTIQFFYYGMYISAIVAGVVMSYLIFKLPRVIALLVIIPIIIFAPINSVITARGYLPQSPHAHINQKELEGLQFLKKQEDGVVLTYPYDEKLRRDIAEPWPLYVYDSTAYVSANSGKASYLEDIPQNQILLTDYKKRIVAMGDFFFSPDSEKFKFLKENNIKYIYIPKIFNQKLSESNNIKNIFENEEVIIYKYKL